MTRSRRRFLGLCSLAIVYLAATSGAGSPQGSLLEDGVLVTWYGNPHTAAMGVLGQAEGNARATALRVQAARYETVTTRQVHAAYHLVATVAQPHPGADGMWRRREFAHVIRGLLHEARVHGFQLILDVQPGRANVADEVRHLGPFLEDPLVHVALDPEFTMTAAQVPGSHIGQLRAADVNRTLDVLEAIVRKHALPKKILILHQFTLGMLPDKEDIRESPLVDVVLCMDGFGSRALKRNTYRSVMRQGRLPFAGFKIFFNQDANPFQPADVMALEPTPVVVVYQ
jgi:hypothetical protein